MGNQKRKKRHESWERLRSLKNKGAAPWICAGDFNEITKQSEKGGGRVKPHHQMQPFHEVLGERGLMDMGFVGSLFTWHKHYPNYTVWERLDRAVATNEWFAKFPKTKIHHLDVTTLDHKALWIVSKVLECRQQRPFRFEQMWMMEEGCIATVEAVWKTGNSKADDIKLIKKIDRC